VVPGGRHEGGTTHNALIAFRDGSYLELLATTNSFVPLLLRILHTTPLWGRLLSRRSPIERRFLGHFGKGTGLVDFAPLASPISSAVHAARERGLAIEGPFTMSRVRSDGERLEWQVAIPLSNDLPFLIEDVTLKEKRVPYGEGAAHRIGASGAAELTVSVWDLEEAPKAQSVQRQGARPTDPRGGTSNDDGPARSPGIGERRVHDRPPFRPS
jgi:hypothetical protein